MACETFAVSQTCDRYVTKTNAENDEIASWLLRLPNNHRS
ncbi:transposase [Achromobacter marplatensis]|nr:transposase [Achromobacter marplatensis]